MGRMAGCGSCGGKRASAAPRWKWVSKDGQQVVTGLTEARARAREAQRGGTASPE